MDLYSSLPKLPWSERDSTESLKFGDFEQKMEEAQASVKKSVKRIKKLKRLLNTEDDAGQWEFEKTEGAIKIAEAALSKAAQDLAIAELSLNAVRQELDADIERPERENDGDTKSSHFTGMLGAFKFLTDSTEKISGTVSHLTVITSEFQMQPRLHF